LVKRTVIFIVFAALGSLLAAGCTSIWGGFDDPQGEVSLAGRLYAANTGGRTFYYGSGLNTGDSTVRNVRVHIDVYNAAGAYLGRFTGPVSAGVETQDDITVTLDTLEVEEQGQFGVNTSVSFGSAGREEVFFTFTTTVFSEL
jgi:hypothetical protein